MKHIKSTNEFKDILRKNDKRIVVIKFGATWCKPCNKIAPLYNKLPNIYKEVIFLSVDIDEVEDIGGKCSVNSLPTFQIYKNREVVNESTGNNFDCLVDKIEYELSLN